MKKIFTIILIVILASCNNGGGESTCDRVIYVDPPNQIDSIYLWHDGLGKGVMVKWDTSHDTVVVNVTPTDIETVRSACD